MKSKTARKIFSALVFFCAAAFFAAQDAALDAYDDSPVSDEASPSKKNSAAKRKKGKSILGFGSDVKAQDMGEGSVFMGGVFTSKMTQREASFIYYPTPDEFAFKTRHQGMSNIPRFDRASRDRIRAAFDVYKNEFDSGVLSSKDKHSYRAYGDMQGNIRWGAVNAASIAKPLAHLGYQIIRKAAYFTISYDDAMAEAPGESRDDTARFIAREFGFTRKQMEQMIALMDEDNLEEIARAVRPELMTEDSYEK